MQLPQPIARLMNEIFSGKNPADLARIGITTITLVLTLLAATAAGSSTPTDDGSSNDIPAPGQAHHPDYVQPDPAVQKKLDTIQAEVYGAVNKMREGQGLGHSFAYPDRQDAAQYKAETNAVTGREDLTDENIGMLQHHLPLEEASGYEFIEVLSQSPEHAAVFMNPTNLHMAVATAYSASDNQVWLVIQFE